MDNKGFNMESSSNENMSSSHQIETSKSSDSESSQTSTAETTGKNKKKKKKQSEKHLVYKLHKAILSKKTLKVFKYLSDEKCIEKITSKDENGRCALHVAAMSGNIISLRVMLALLENRNPDIRDHEGKTPFFKATQANDLKSMKDLSLAGANIQARDFKGDSPLDYIIKNYSAELLPILEYLVESCQTSINDKNDEGYAPLHLSAMHGHTDLTKYLIDHDATVCIKDLDGKTPYELAEKYERAKTADLLRYYTSNNNRSANSMSEVEGNLSVYSSFTNIKKKHAELQAKKQDYRKNLERIKKNCEFLEKQIKEKENSKDQRTDDAANNESKFDINVLIPRRGPRQNKKQLNDRERKIEKVKVETKIKELKSHYQSTFERVDDLKKLLESKQEELESLKSIERQKCTLKDNNSSDLEYRSYKLQILELENQKEHFTNTLKEIQDKFLKFSDVAMKDQAQLKTVLENAEKYVTNLNVAIEEKSINNERLKTDLKNRKKIVKENLNTETALKKQYLQMKQNIAENTA